MFCEEKSGNPDPLTVGHFNIKTELFVAAK
jgi:hypothetical protein